MIGIGELDEHTMRTGIRGPAEADQRQPHLLDQHMYGARRPIENFSGEIEQFLAIATRYNKSRATSLPPFSSLPASFG